MLISEAVDVVLQELRHLDDALRGVCGTSISGQSLKKTLMSLKDIWESAVFRTATRSLY